MPKKTISNRQNGNHTESGRAGQGKGGPKKHTPVILGVILAVLIGIQSVAHSPILDQLIPVVEQLTGEALQGYLEDGTGGGNSGQAGSKNTGQKNSGQGSGASGRGEQDGSPEAEYAAAGSGITISLEEIPAYSGEPVIVLNENQPMFTPGEMTVKSFEYYSPLDELGRCGPASASVGRDIMPTEKRGSISSVKPTGWKTAKYDIVDGEQLYNRCHLIGFQLTGENANEKNLITGTRYLNVDGMLPFENLVADYVKETGNHVMYRVTPVFEGDNLVAHGLFMEGKSVEDEGEGVCFFVYAYNVQPGIEIDYETGESWLTGK